MSLPKVFACLMCLLLVAGWMVGCAADDDDDDNDDAMPADDDDATDDDATPGDDDDDDNDDDDNDDSAECDDGETACTDDALNVLVCEQGAWRPGEKCLADQGRLCEAGACVDPWRYGSPTFDSCAGDPHATAASLSAKAAHYDEIAARLHIHPDHKRIQNVTLDEGYTEDDATWENVVNWHTGENDGLWTGLYIASQAFRYAVTGSGEALDNLEVMLEGMVDGVRITGVPGLFTREYITPGIAGMSCPTDPSAYVPDVEKDDNRWVKVDTDGTILVYDTGAADFVRTDHQVPARFAGYCWLDNVSQDEYAGHMLALGAVLMLVDDEAVYGMAATLAEEVAAHLMDNDMAVVDWDGRLVEHGRFWPLALTDFPGFNSIMGLNMVKQGAVASGREDLLDYYDNCLLQKNGPVKCIDQPISPPVSFANYLWIPGLYVGVEGCQSNWNNMAIAFCQMFPLVWFEHDPVLRNQLHYTLENRMFYFRENPREIAAQHNAAWALMYASMKRLGPGSTGQDVAAVEDALCALRQFPESKVQPSLEVGEDLFPTDLTCESRFEGRFLTFDPIPVHQRCPGTFTWWSNPYEHEYCEENLRSIRQPADYLLPYWMARYFEYVAAGE
jgi:hypothetical protein